MRVHELGSVTHVMGGLDEFSGITIDLAHHVCLIQVPMVPLVIRRHINIHNVPILQRPLIWYTMTDDLHRQAALWNN